MDEEKEPINMTQAHLNRIIELSNQYKVPGEKKMKNRLLFISKMLWWYDKRCEEVGGAQYEMFKSYCATLLYAESIIKHYNELTKEINKIAEEIENETRTSSKS